MASTQTTNRTSNAPAVPGTNSVTTTQSTTQIGTNANTTVVDPPGTPQVTNPPNNHTVSQGNLQLAQNTASVQITGNGNTVTIVQVIEQVAQNIANAMFAPPPGSSGSVQVNQFGGNVASQTYGLPNAPVNISANGQTSTVNQTIVQFSANAFTSPQPTEGSGQSSNIAQVNGNLAAQSSAVVITGNNNTITIVQTIIQIAQNLSTTLVPRDGQSTATGSASQVNVNAAQSSANAVSITGNGNTVTINQSITQVATNENDQLVPGVPAQVLAAAAQQLQQPVPVQVSSSVTLGVSGGGGVPPELIHLTATVTGNAPTGTVSFLFFSNGNCGGSGSSAGTAALIPLSPTSASAISNGVTLSAAGTYSFTAAYSGDPANAPTSSGCVPFTVP